MVHGAAQGDGAGSAGNRRRLCQQSGAVYGAAAGEDGSCEAAGANEKSGYSDDGVLSAANAWAGSLRGNGQRQSGLSRDGAALQYGAQFADASVFDGRCGGTGGGGNKAVVLKTIWIFFLG